jgi:hypothetical protein
MCESLDRAAVELAIHDREFLFGQRSPLHTSVALSRAGDSTVI